ncbi:uncharacterized protein [Eucyclogobius newberryi]|uniref:uncharacterized protein n=1 Tax=Eucyclogobius newberryi TaxID=166745 RepID=UPI003B5ACDB3
MQQSQRLDQKLHVLREEVRTMSREKEQVEKVWRERLHRCQRQLQAKEDEMIRQSQYFESFKSQLQHKLKQGRDREETLQNRVYTLEKQLLDMTVTAATGLVAMGPVRITAGSVAPWEEEDRLPSLRGEGEGEEEKKEERKKQWTKSLGDERGKDKDSDQIRLQGFILSLQEDLRVLLEREEKAMTEHRALMEQLHEAQESSHFWGCKVEEMKCEIDHLNLSKVSLEEEVEELREENQRQQQSLRDADNLPNNADVCIQKAHISDEEQPSPSAVLPDHHQAAAERSQNGPVDSSSAAKSETSLETTNGPQTPFGNFGSQSNPSFQSLTLTTETIDELRMGAWCYNGVLNLDEGPGEDSDALREAYRSLVLGGDLDFIKEQRDRFEEALQQANEQLNLAVLENASLRSQIRQQEEETSLRQDSSKDTMFESSALEDSARFSIGSDDLVQALNEENRALAERIQELRDHIELRDEEMRAERSEVKEQICRLEIDGARQQQEINEQACLATELTKKTEDDLNTIMELQQKLLEHEELKEDIRRKKLFGFQSKHTQTVFRKDNIDECVDLVVNCVIESDREPQFTSKHEVINDATQTTGKSTDDSEVILMSEEVDRLTKLVQSLRTEQEDLTGRITSQTSQQKEVAQSIRAQTEEKQRLTREVWGLKEEKDHIFKSLAGLKQEREVLSRAVCGFKDEKDQFHRSLAGLQQEKEHLFQAVPNLKKEQDTILESISSGIKERDQVLQSIQSLHGESEQLSRAVFKLKQEKDELSSHLKRLEGKKDTEHLHTNLEEECAKLQKVVSGLKEEEKRLGFSVSRLKQEENQMTILKQQLQEEHHRLEATSPSQSKTSAMDPAYPGDYEEQYGYQNNSEDQNESLMQIQTLSAELQQSQDELEETKAERQRLQSELLQSESKRDEAERRASQFADRLFKVADESNQLQESRRERDSLKAQVTELQNRWTSLSREKNEALALKTQIVEQYNVLTAQLKAKTVALQELNSEYISLKHGQGIRDDLGAALVSLQTRYSDIRAKYDALLHKKSQADMNVAPLKAKLSCLVVKCQERNHALVQMTKIAQKHGCIDYILKQQVEQLLADPALQSYASTFTTGFTPEITVTFEDATRFTHDQPCSSQPPKLQQTSEFTPQSTIYGGGRSSSMATSTFSTFANSPRDGTSKMSHESSPTVKTFSPKSISPLPEHREVFGSTSPKDSSQVNVTITETFEKISSFSFNLLSPSIYGRKLNRSTSPVLEKALHEILVSTSPAAPQKSHTNSTKHQLSPGSARGSALKINELPQLNVKAKSSPDLTRLTESSGFCSGAGSSSSLTCFGPSKSLSSPEKIMSLQEQLQKTLLGSFQAPAGRGRGPQPRKGLSFSAQSLAFPTAPQMQKTTVYNSTANMNHTAASSSQPKAVHSDNKLFNAVVSRSATVTFSPVAQAFKQSNVSRASSNVSTSCAVQSKSTLTPHTTDLSIKELKPSPLQNKTTFPRVAPTTTDRDVPKRPDAPEGAAPDTTGPSRSPSVTVFSQADVGGSLASPPLTSAKKSQSCAEKARTPTRMKQEAPAEVRSIEVIKAVGVSGLMIGWERPPLDELGCSNGTFVYGYRVLVDGVFHKSVMSSACTKCILENVNLSVPIKISVQTLGSNGLSSNCVHTMYIQKA